MTSHPNDNNKHQHFFVSWRWRVVLPMFIVGLLVAMSGTYFLVTRFSSGFSISQDNILLESVRGVDSRANTLYQRQLQEAQRIAFTIGIPEAVEQGQANLLYENLEALARTGNIDSIILTDTNGIEAIGIQRVQFDDGDDYAVNTGTNLSTEPLVMAALDGRDSEAGLMDTPEGLLIFISVPMRVDNQIIGAALVGNKFSSVLDALQGSVGTNLIIYNINGEISGSTFEANPDLAIEVNLLQDTLERGDTNVSVRTRNIGETPYRTAYIPLKMGNFIVGVVAILLPDSVPFATEIGRQLAGLMASTLIGSVIVVAFVGIGMFTKRVEHVQRTAEALVQGKTKARTNLRPTDEVGATGAALDAYANYVQKEHDNLEQSLRRQRRETNHLFSVLESIPDGIIVQDIAGRVTLINDEARNLIGSQRILRQNATLAELSSLVNQVLGSALAPGIYTLGDPQTVSINNKMLNAQAAAIITISGERIGSVIVLRDITEFVQKEQARERLLKDVEEQIQSPLAEFAQESALTNKPLDEFTREITKRAIALHKLIVEIRELTDIDVHNLQQIQKAIGVDALIWTIANEWRQIALAADIKLDVVIEKHSLYILGDEKRLRWAIGNIIDNAIKYTSPGGMVTLEITGDTGGHAMLRIRDNGVGILPDELPKVATRFYRGNPTTKSGDIIRTPGMGQGLYIAQQILKAHGGQIKVKSKPTIGTAVYFSLPLTSASAMDLPIILEESFEGETVKLPEDYRLDL